jgi:diguanylate cyclase (GGDEF)-like protein
MAKPQYDESLYEPVAQDSYDKNLWEPVADSVIKGDFRDAKKVDQYDKALWEPVDETTQEEVNKKPYTSALKSSVAGFAASLGETARLGADIVNKPINAAVKATGITDTDVLGKAPKLPGVEKLQKYAKQYTAPKARESWDDQSTLDDKADWIGQNLTQQAPNMALNVLSMWVAPLRAVTLPLMAASSAGSQYAENTAAGRENAQLDAVLNGIIEYGTERASLGVFDKIRSVIGTLGTPLAKASFVKSVLQRTAAAVGGIAATAGEEGIEEIAAQYLQNLSQINVAGDTSITPTSGVKEAAILGAAGGGVMAAPFAGQIASKTRRDDAPATPGQPPSQPPVSNLPITSPVITPADDYLSDSDLVSQANALEQNQPPRDVLAAQSVDEAITAAQAHVDTTTVRPVATQASTVTEQPSAQVEPIMADTILSPARTTPAIPAETAIQPPVLPQVATSVIPAPIQPVSQIATPTQTGDIARTNNVPFQTEKSSALYAKASKLEGYQPIQVGPSQWVLRKQLPAATEQAKEKPVPDLLHTLAQVGLDRTHWEKQGIDKAVFRQQRQAGGFGRPLFRKDGGMTLDETAEFLSQRGFLPEGQYDAKNALALVDRALRGEKIYSTTQPQGLQEAVQTSVTPIAEATPVEPTQPNDQSQFTRDIGYVNRRIKFLEARKTHTQSTANELRMLREERDRIAAKPATEAAPVKPEVTLTPAVPAAAPVPPASAQAPAASESKPAEQTDIEDFAKPERRTDKAARKKVSEMTQEEMRVALFTEHKTGLYSDRAYAEHKRLPIQVAIDVDSLKYVNDNMGHSSGDRMLRLLADALTRNAQWPYRIGGDEFVVQASTPAEAEAIMSAVNADLKDAVIEYTAPDGTKYRKTGVGFSYGTGTDFESADQSLANAKRERERAGLRAGRGRKPSDLVEEPATGRRDNEGQPGQEVTAPQANVLGQMTEAAKAMTKAAEALTTAVESRTENRDNVSPMTPKRGPGTEEITRKTPPKPDGDWRNTDAQSLDDALHPPKTSLPFSAVNVDNISKALLAIKEEKIELNKFNSIVEANLPLPPVEERGSTMMGDISIGNLVDNLTNYFGQYLNDLGIQYLKTDGTPYRYGKADKSKIDIEERHPGEFSIGTKYSRTTYKAKTADDAWQEHAAIFNGRVMTFGDGADGRMVSLGSPYLSRQPELYDVIISEFRKQPALLLQVMRDDIEIRKGEESASWEMFLSALRQAEEISFDETPEGRRAKFSLIDGVKTPPSPKPSGAREEAPSKTSTPPQGVEANKAEKPAEAATKEAAISQLYIEFAGQRHPVESFKDASEKWGKFRDQTGIGSSDLDENPLIKDESGKTIAHIAYNGKIVSDVDATVAENAHKPKPEATTTAPVAESKITETDQGTALFSRRQDQTKTPEFLKWFGDSKVVDENGEPLIVYHGSDSRSEFNALKGGTLFFTTSSSHLANQYTGYGDDFNEIDITGQVVPVFINSGELPLIIDARGGTADRIPLSQKLAQKLDPEGEILTGSGHEFLDDIATKARGDYDSLIVRNVVMNGKTGERNIKSTVVVAFYADQIKSAIGNRGTFDTENPDIRFSRNLEQTGKQGALSTSDVEEIIAPVLKKWENAPQIKVVETAEQVPVAGKTDGVEGAYLSDGTIYLVSSNLPTRQRVMQVLAHEAIGHAGMEKVFGPEYRKILKLADMMERSGNKAVLEAAKYVDSEQPGIEQEQRSKEIIAVLAERGIHNSLMLRVRAAIQRFLRAIGINVEFNDADMAAYIRSAESYLEGKIEAGPVSDDMQGQPLFSRKSNNATSQAGWDIDEGSTMDSFIREMQNRHIDTKRAIDAINKSSGQIGDNIDVYLKEELYHKRKAKRVKDFQDRELKPLLVDMRMRNVSVDQIEEYLHARHAKEANKHIADMFPDDLLKQDGQSGMTNQEADDYLKNLPAEQKRKLEKLAERVDAILDKTRQTLVTYQVEDRDTVDGWKDMFGHYVPLFREDMNGAPGVGQGFTVRGSSTRHRKGSTANVVDILANIAMQRERAITRGEKNRVDLALYGLVKTHPNPDFWRIAKPGISTAISSETGEPVEVVDLSYQKRDNVLMARTIDKDGKIKQVGVEFNEQNERSANMARALRNLDVDDLGEVLSRTAVVTRFIASMSTQYNPIFGVFNLIRDTEGAMLNLSSTPLAGKQKDVLKKIGPALIGIYQDIRDIRKGTTPSSPYAAMWEDMQLVGGTTGYSELFKTSKDRADALLREIDNISSGRAKKAGREIMGWLSDYNETMENAVRLAVYEVALDAGISKERAASISKNITVNFNRKGRIASQAGALYAFFNAAAQGTARTIETMTGPAGQKILIGGLLVGVAQALALAAAGFGDDDPPKFVRERNLIIPLTLVSGKRNYVSIPMPLGIHILPNIGRLLTEMILTGKVGEKTVDLFRVTVDAFNPLGSATIAQMISPTPTDPIIALAENKDWTDKTIYLEDYNRLAPTPGHARAKDVASAPARWMAWGVNWITGGSDYRPGGFSPTPDQIDYLVAQAFGGVGREVMKTAQAVQSIVTGEELPTYKVPLFGRLYGNADRQDSQSTTFYSNIKRLNEHEAEIKGRLKHGESIADYRRSNPEIRFIGVGNMAERTISKLREQKRELLDRGASRDRIRQIDMRITTTMKRFNEQVDIFNENVDE